MNEQPPPSAPKAIANEQNDFGALEIMRMTGDILTLMAQSKQDIQFKIAALRSAADVLAQAVSAAAMSVAVLNALRPKQ